MNMTAVNQLYDRIAINSNTILAQKMGRSWLEINTENLKWNAHFIQSLMPPYCEMMAVVKANAYGHGATIVSACMNEVGVRSFAVATIDEGIELRREGIEGDILILGYTDITRANELEYYCLIQTIIDYNYAVLLNGCGNALQVHIKVDTGMHRLGVCVEDINKITEIFHYSRLDVRGIYTHLNVSECLKEEDVNYTRGQIDRFYKMLSVLTNRGISIPKVHIQSSYGLFNYPELHCDYARIGIALYGPLNLPGHNKKHIVQLRPVLSLKARVVIIQEVAAGESVGYGRDSVLGRDSRIAVLPVGYADGIPRNLSNGVGCALLHGKRVPIIGRICMDQLMIDVTDIPKVKPGDVATLIGVDGQEEISANFVANKAGSIANELYSRLGSRLDRIYR